MNAWRALLGETPDVWPRWLHILPLLADVVDALERVERLSPRLQAVELHRVAESLLPLLKSPSTCEQTAIASRRKTASSFTLVAGVQASKASSAEEAVEAVFERLNEQVVSVFDRKTDPLD